MVVNRTRRGGSSPASAEDEAATGNALFFLWWPAAAHVGIMLVAAVMRLWDLGSRAMHHDESLHAFYSWRLFSGEGYQHDPMMHGPFQMEATAGLFFLFGDSDYTARLLYALAGIALVGLPYLFRSRLGTLGALVVSTMLAFSPAMLYFSRFARNDILMAVWTFGLVLCMWRYIDEGKNRYLYIGAAILALAFATKETAYIVTATLGLYLVLLAVHRNWNDVKRGVTIGEMSPPAVLWRILAGAWSVAARGLRMTGLSRPAEFLVVLFTLSLPMGAAAVSVLQDTPLLSWSGLVLASSAEGPGPAGAPTRGGLVIATLAVLAMLWLSAYLGFRWSRSVWWRCALIFFAVWVLLYSTFFTHIGGIGSGMWQSLGYWLVQQGVARGTQPWYYYLLITPLYEFLPMLLAIAGSIYYLRRKDTFGRFLVFWAVTTLILYTIASEKMPWLLVNVTLPLIVLGGKFFADAVTAIQWRSRRLEGLLIVAAVPVFLGLLWAAASVFANIFVVLASLALLIGLGVMGSYLARGVGYRYIGTVALVPIAAMLLGFSVFTGLRASFENGDVPVEMIVYTQTSPDIVEVLRDVVGAGSATGEGKAIPVNIDPESGFSWPWAWYLRDYTSVGYSSYKGSPLQSVPDSVIQLVHSNNQAEAGPLLADGFTEAKRIRHRWWFPEDYRGVTVGKFLRGVTDPQAWRSVTDYFLFRKGIEDKIGSEDAYVYFSREIMPGISPPQ